MTAATIGSFARDARVISLVAVAHAFSHFYQLALPPLFPFLRAEFDVSYASLGAMMGVFYTCSGIGQFLAGFAVDRFGARVMLFGGLALLATGVLVSGLVPAFWLLFPIAAIMGLGNSVFHPADFSILNASVDPRRLGHAYSTHGIGGNLGWALAPVLSYGLGSTVGWRPALLIMGAIGLGVLAMLMVNRALLASESRHAAGAHSRAAPGSASVFLQKPVLLCFTYFALVAVALVGIQTFGPTALHAALGTPLAVAVAGVTGYMLGGAGGILLGGFIAGWTQRHDLVAASGMLVAAALMSTFLLPLPSWSVIPLLTVIGFAMGVTNPSRDLIVRRATPKGASGRVYGFVYSGLDLGALVAPLYLGALLDRGQPSWVFVVITVGLLLSILSVIQVRRSSLVPAVAAD